jgi:hypothetical protein
MCGVLLRKKNLSYNKYKLYRYFKILKLINIINYKIINDKGIIEKIINVYLFFKN